MLDYELGQSPSTLAEFHQLRLEAMRLFDECLTSGNELPFVQFIERQLAQPVPPLHLLREIGDDLQLRLLALKAHHFDVRERVVSTLSESFGVDITALAPASQLEHYHKLEAATLIAFVRQHGQDLSEDDLALLHHMIVASLEMAAQLQGDIQMTHRMHRLVVEWLGGMHSSTVRQQWPGSEPHVPPARALHH